MTVINDTNCTTARPVATPRGLFTLIGHAIALRKQRRALAMLGTDQLCDLGLSRTDARAESERSAWDVPSNWVK